MDELVINLDQFQEISKKGRIFNTLLGSVLIMVSVLAIFSRISAGQGLRGSLFFIVVFILGVNVILYTYGIFFRIRRRYIVITSGGVEYKLSYFYPSRTIYWDDLKRVDIKTLRIFFHEKKGSVVRMKLGEVYYNDIKRLKLKIASCCTAKGIVWTDTTVESDISGSKSTKITPDLS
jgi:hypothetical protein